MSIKFNEMKMEILLLIYQFNQIMFLPFPAFLPHISDAIEIFISIGFQAMSQ